jgi:hypothetical protein
MCLLLQYLFLGVGAVWDRAHFHSKNISLKQTKKHWLGLVHSAAGRALAVTLCC